MWVVIKLNDLLSFAVKSTTFFFHLWKTDDLRLLDLFRKGRASTVWGIVQADQNQLGEEKRKHDKNML